MFKNIWNFHKESLLVQSFSSYSELSAQHWYENMFGGTAFISLQEAVLAELSRSTLICDYKKNPGLSNLLNLIALLYVLLNLCYNLYEDISKLKQSLGQNKQVKTNYFGIVKLVWIADLGFFYFLFVQLTVIFGEVKYRSRKEAEEKK